MEIIFYIFASITLIAAMYIAFSQGSKAAAGGLVYIAAGASGLYLLVNSQLISSILLLVALMLVSIYNLGSRYFINHLFNEPPAKNNFISVLLISIFTAVFTALLGAAKWQKFDIDFGYSNFALIFTKYLPLLFILALTVSVFLGVVYKMFIQLRTEMK